MVISSKSSQFLLPVTFFLVAIVRVSAGPPCSVKIQVKEGERVPDRVAELEDYINERRCSKENTTAPPFRGVPASPEIINQYFQDVIPAYFQQTQTCSDYNLIVGMLINRVRQGGTEKEIEDLMANLCAIARYSQAVCAGLAKRLAPTFYYVVKNRTDLTSEIFVANVFQSDGCTTTSTYNEWMLSNNGNNNAESGMAMTTTTDPNTGSSEGNIRITMKVQLQLSTPCQRFPKTFSRPIAIPVSTSSSYSRNKKEAHSSTPKAVPVKSVPKQSRPFKIVHLTDIHVDPRYEVSTNAACENKILCCHMTDGAPANASVSAGLWGHAGRCDTPLITLESALKHINSMHSDADLIYMSGDLIPHNMWYTNKDDNAKYIEEISSTIRSFLPKAKVVPIFGNHEPHPVNMISPEESPDNINTAWITNVTYHSWLNWIPQSSAEEYAQTGHYSYRVTDKFRILVFNSNVCFGFNFWQLYRIDESKSQLLWLRQELQKSMDADEMVHILGHVPPGYLGCNKIFSRNYYQLVANYSNIIRGQFFGHLHKDTFRVYYSTTNKTIPINTQWISPSLTPYKSNNPAYKVFYADPSTLEIINYETYILDLQRVNAEVVLEPEWQLLYSATDAYGIHDTKVDSLSSFVNSMAKNEKLFSLYYRNMHKAINASQVTQCNTYCKKRFLCRIVRPYVDAQEECELIQLKVDGGIVPIYDQYSAV